MTGGIEEEKEEEEWEQKREGKSGCMEKNSQQRFINDVTEHELVYNHPTLTCMYQHVFT